MDVGEVVHRAFTNRWLGRKAPYVEWMVGCKGGQEMSKRMMLEELLIW